MFSAFGFRKKKVVSGAAFTFTVTSDGDNSFALPLVNGGTYDFNVDWGDGTDDDITVWSDTAKDHTYPSASTEYTITITGTITGWAFNDGGDNLLMGHVTSWGPLATGAGALSYGMFSGCLNMTVAVSAGGINIAGCTNMGSMFQLCSAMTSPPDVSNWDTSSVTAMDFMFFYCSSMTSPPDVSNWDTSAVTDMSYMFFDCEVMTSPPDVSNWDTSSVTGMDYMFYYCPSMTSPPDVSNWDTSSVTGMSYMFFLCSSMATAPDVSGWNIEELTDATDFMNSCTPMSTAAYDAVLVAWEAQAEKPNVLVHFGTSTYTDPSAAATARAALVSSGWTLTDGGTA